MPIIDNQELYNYAKQLADEKYKKPSAYKSGYIVKKYKELGGTYTDDNKPKDLKRWRKEVWKDIGDEEYPVYRPTKRISKDTPLTVEEIDPENIEEQIKLKQKIKGDSNLPPFKPKNFVSLGVEANKISKSDEIWNYSNPKEVQKKAKKYLGNDVKVYRSIKKDKKYMVFNPNTNKLVHFGQIGFSDFTKHKDEKRRERYLARATKIKGNWKDNPYSSNNMSLWILWNWNGKNTI